jgi:thiamine-phosphate pyrophosphorylase
MDIEFLTSYKDSYKSSVLDVSLEVLKNGVDSFQFCWVGEDYYTIGQELRALCKEYNVPFIVNNDVKAALTLKADGVHLGPTDTCLIEARKVLPNSCSIGYTINSLKQLDNEYYKYSDYLGVGPIFNTTTNTNTFDNTVGIDSLLYITQKTKKPVIAIGGITTKNASEIKERGVNKVAIIGDIYRSSDIQKTLNTIKNL